MIENWKHNFKDFKIWLEFKKVILICTNVVLTSSVANKYKILENVTRYNITINNYKEKEKKRNHNR